MSAELISLAAARRPARRTRAGRAPGRAVRPVVGALPDGTACYAPVGEIVITDDAQVICHLCGRALRSVTAHLKAHGWTKDAYCEAFGLERGQSLEGPETRKLRAAAFGARLIFDPAIRQGSAAGRQRARSGDLGREAASASCGRPIPEQRRRKAMRALGAVSPDAVARANSARAQRHRAAVGDAIAQRFGYADLGAFVLARVAGGTSLAAVSREAGLHKDRLSRHLASIDPAAAAAARRSRPDAHDLTWLPAVRRLGFTDVPGYLRTRHEVQHWTVAAIGAEVGMSHHAVESALRRHQVARMRHAARRHAAARCAAEVARRLGFDSVGDYVSCRRAAGWTWQAMAQEAGQPQSWLRRHAVSMATAPLPP
ncbi:MAG: MucR family transcriptional regulator [Streptosporangiaceae bacterium]